MANKDRWCFTWVPARKASVGADKAALLKEAKWQPGDIITVSFLNGDEAVRKIVEKYAQEWVGNGLADLELDFRKDTTDTVIRISFQHPGSWSALGIGCRQVPKSQPTMNYGWLTPELDPAEARRVVLHEFGHALGLIHEHQNPKKNPIEFNKQAVIADLSGPPNNWTLEQIEFNVFQPYAQAALLNTEFDEDSIMMYPIPLRWTTNDKSFDLNSKISKRDADLIREAYS